MEWVPWRKGGQVTMMREGIVEGTGGEEVEWGVWGEKERQRRGKEEEEEEKEDEEKEKERE